MTDVETVEPLFPTLPKRGKIVLQHTTGPLSGMYRIMGDIAEAPFPYPEFVLDVDLLSHHAPANLVAVKRSYVLYREVMDPKMNKLFNERQQ